MLYLQKGNFQKVVRCVAGTWMTANQATYFGLAFVVLTALSYILGLKYEGARWLLLLTKPFSVLKDITRLLACLRIRCIEHSV